MPWYAVTSGPIHACEQADTPIEAAVQAVRDHRIMTGGQPFEVDDQFRLTDQSGNHTLIESGVISELIDAMDHGRDGN